MGERWIEEREGGVGDERKKEEMRKKLMEDGKNEGKASKTPGLSLKLKEGR